MTILTADKAKALLDSGNWIIRTDNNGVSYQGFKWKRKGAWTHSL